MQVDERKQRILEALILDYIATGDPVGSRTIARKYKLGVSSATIRNEMADLEELGFIEQPYTSAGRIPSEQGYRYYVDCLMELKPLADSIKRYVQDVLVDRIRETEALIQLTSKLLSQLTNYTAIIMAPNYGKNILRHVQLLSLENNRIVLVIVLDNGHVEHRTLDFPTQFEEKDLQTLSYILNRHLRGLSLEQWKAGIFQEIYNELDYQKRFLNQVIELLENVMSVEHESKVYLGGTLNILNQPEFRNVEKVKELFELLEEERVLKEVLSTGPSVGLTVRIGSENPYEGMKNCSLITAAYEVDGNPIGTLGVLGPTRMEYSKSVSMVEFFTTVLADALKKVK